ncbi:MAG: amidohydrolase family protein [Candidatus Margulisiibacteriota bacterium]
MPSKLVVIDAHVHLYSKGKASGQVAANMRSRARFEQGGIFIPGVFIKDIIDGNFDAAAYSATAARAGITRAILVPVATRPNLVASLNLKHAEIQAQFPGNFISLGTLYPHATEAALTAAMDFIGQNFIGIKMHSLLQMFNPSDPAMFALYQALAERRLFTQWHMGSHPGINSFLEGFCATPEKLIPIYRQFFSQDAAPMLWAHLGGAELTENQLAFLVDHPAIYLDLAFTFPPEMAAEEGGTDPSLLAHDGRYDYFFAGTAISALSRTIEKIGIERIVFGSDYPFSSPVAALRAANRLFDQLGLTQEDRAKVLAGNAANFLGLVAQYNPATQGKITPFLQAA